MTDFSTMTDSQLNEWLAVEVMGWHEDSDHMNLWLDKDGEITTDKEDWQPARDLNKAVMCADYMANLGFSWTVENVENDHYHACVLRPSNRTMFDCDTADTPARALSIAVCMAVEGEG